MRRFRRLIVMAVATVIVGGVGSVAAVTQTDGISWGSAAVGGHSSTTGMTWG